MLFMTGRRYYYWPPGQVAQDCLLKTAANQGKSLSSKPRLEVE